MMAASQLSRNLRLGHQEGGRVHNPWQDSEYVLSPSSLAMTAVVVVAALICITWILDAENQPLAYAVIHALLACTLAYGFVNVLAAHAGDRLFYPPCILCTVHILYFSASTICYFSDNPVYMEFQLGLGTRLMGNLLVGAVIGVFIAILRRHLASHRNASAWQAMKVPSTPACALFALLSWCLKGWLIGRGFGSPYSDAVLNLNTAAPGELVTIVFIAAFGYCATAVAVFGYYRRKTPTARVVMWGALLGELLWHAVCTASRTGALTTILVWSAVSASFCSPRRREWGYSTLFLAIALGPAAIGVGNSAILAALGRNAEGSLQDSCDETAYRLSLSDYAMVLLDRTAPWETASGILRDAVTANLPRILVPDKVSESEASADIHAEVGIYGNRDYPDTLFSAGAMLAGWPGMIVLPCLYFLGICALSAWLIKRASGFYGFFLLSLTIGSFNVELGLLEIVATGRLLLGVYTPIAAVFWLASRLSASSPRPVLANLQRSLRQT